MPSLGTISNWGIATLNPAAQAITLDALAKAYGVLCAVVHATGAAFTTMDLGGVGNAMTGGTGESAGEIDSQTFYAEAPTTGSSSVDWALSARDDGPIVIGVEARGTGAVTVAGTAAGGTSANVTSSTGDLVVAVAWSLDEPPGIGGTGATSQLTFDFSNLFCNVFTLTAGASSTTGTASGIEPSITMISFHEEAGGGGSVSDPPGGGAARQNLARNAVYRMKRRDRIYVPARLAA